ncbi:hypothetical protein [Microlunatus sp. Y2014]|uniref:arsenate reductase/protein-tyrosine-phosphatase family protein n=1 Tax=Microlunatus sp. Y2014 TaxID=3418488 RepID=UPI003DA731F1
MPVLPNSIRPRLPPPSPSSGHTEPVAPLPRRDAKRLHPRRLAASAPLRGWGICWGLRTRLQLYRAPAHQYYGCCNRIDASRSASVPYNFHVLVVCTGNICRSPAVERLLANAWGGSVHVSSAGTRALVDLPVDPPMENLLTGLGVSSRGFAARLLTEEMVREAQLVLTLTREHRGSVVELLPGAVRRTFTLRELARIISMHGLGGPYATYAEGLSALVFEAGRLRTSAPPQRPTDDDIIDPYGQSRSTFEESFEQIRLATDTIIAAVGNGPGVQA